MHWDHPRVHPRSTMEIGKNYLFMTVTHYWTGRVRALTHTEVTLDSSAWIPDTGRLADAIKSGVVTECEPTGDGVVIPRQGTAAIPWHHNLPSTQK